MQSQFGIYYNVAAKRGKCQVRTDPHTFKTLKKQICVNFHPLICIPHVIFSTSLKIMRVYELRKNTLKCFYYHFSFHVTNRE